MNVPIHSLSRIEIENFFVQALNGKKLCHVATVNPEFLVEANKNDTFERLLQSKTALNLCDGVGIQLLANILYGQKIRRISGVETAKILIKICEQEQKKVSLIGGFGVVEECQKILKKEFPKLIFSHCEDGNPNEISSALIDSKPDVVLVAFGAPKQEFWIQKFADKTTAKVAIGIGGTFDFWVGKSIRAPKCLQKIGFEWLWRLITEPKRFGRIFKAVVVFPLLAIKERVFKWKS